MSSNDTKAGQVQETVHIVFADPVGLHEARAQAELAGQLQDGLPELIVIDHDEAGRGVAMSADLHESAEDVDGVEDVAEQDVVELLA